MDTRETLVGMLRQLMREMDVVQSQGAGYYSCSPFAARFNKLLRLARPLFPTEDSIIASFDALGEHDPKDPGDKSKVLLAIRIEIGQLISLLESTREGLPS